MKKFVFLLIMFYGSTNLMAQTHQTLRGIIKDKESNIPMTGVIVTIEVSGGEIIGTNSDIDGRYMLSNVPLGRQQVRFQFLGYSEIIIGDVVFNSAKEVLMDIEMEEQAMALGELVVEAGQSGELINEMAVIGGRSFSVNETERYAGSRGDPSRMATNFAGVQGADDSRNDIVIRGNTPQGLLWRMEGVNIPNPNHFAIPGTVGGPVTILNNKFMANSDFFTAAFPAEYANGISGVFDLDMRNGNTEHHEFSGQLGFLGTEVTAEGPLSKKDHSSYLAMYRYSTLELFGFLGIDVGTDAIPKYQDGAFRFNFPGKKGSTFSVFGMGGSSAIGIVLSDAQKPDTATVIYGQNDRDQYFASDMGVLGISYVKPLKKSGYLKMTLSASHANVDSDHYYIYRHVDENGNYVLDSLPHMLDYYFRENKYSFYALYNKKLNARTSLRAGLNADLYDVKYIDSSRTINTLTDPNTLESWVIHWDAADRNIMLQPFIHFRHQFSEKLTGTAGLTALYYSLNRNSLSPLEPRLGLSYQLDARQKISLGTGLHSQIQSSYMYYYSNNTIDRDPQEYNLDVGLTKSAHAVMGYDRILSDKLRVKAEVYYQYVFDVPVDTFSSSFSMVNAGSGFERVLPSKLENTGTQQNLGMELTLEKSFGRGYYYMMTGSLYSAQYKGSDGISRNTTFNGRYAFNALFAKEFVTRKDNVWNFGTKITYAGGRWYGPVDKAASDEKLEIVYVDATVNSEQFKPYFRTDIKVNYRLNADKVTHEFGLDLVNIFDTQNILTLSYLPDSPDDNPIREEYQLGFLPLFYYKIDF